MLLPVFCTLKHPSKQDLRHSLVTSALFAVPLIEKGRFSIEENMCMVLCRIEPAFAPKKAKSSNTMRIIEGED